MFGFGKKRETLPVELPAILMDDNPVNYDSVLDYLVGLDSKEYTKLLKVTDIYREANKSAAKVLGVQDQPTTKLKDDAPTDDEIDEGLDGLLEINPNDLKDAIINAPEKPEIKKEQSPSKAKKITVNGK